ncbi:hypothetical protein ACFQZ4_45810 [Catellatospora coxensis]|uniref:Uncharacterized protein n=1 Tax=Catellatospora coxensis TaxID=310354 RepID=A0A8J3L0W7_9ACTN|nr:hypothetical protein [Catellatospora coxensis]GIG05710.1 hypothetical protein Cco03nite_24100 [Catellatospora coxensis]
MALHLKRDHRGRQYFAISCDDCGTWFTAFDDGCYRYASLRLEAVLAGWDAPAGPDPAHRCPDCVGDGNRVRPGNLANAAPA